MSIEKSRTASDLISSGRQASARMAGVAYLATIAAGLYAEVFVRGSLRVAGDANATATNIASAHALYRFGILADLVMLSSYVVVTALLYRLLKPAGSTLSLTAALFSLTGIAMLAASTAFLILPSILLGDASYLSAIPPDERAALAYAGLQAHGFVYAFTGIFFGLYCVSIGWLVICSRELPPLVGWLMVVAGATFLFDTSIDLIAPALGRLVPDAVMVFSVLGEGSLAVWLTLFGVDRPRIKSGRGPERHIRN